jgi:hypothetical protein
MQSSDIERNVSAKDVRPTTLKEMAAAKKETPLH